MEENKNCCGGFDYSKFKGLAGLLVGALSLFLVTKIVTEVAGWPSVGKDVPPQATITVSGKGEIVRVPDIATFSFSVTEESLDVAVAQDSAAKTSNAILAFLEKSGVNKKDIQTSGYNIYPRYEYSGKYGYGGKQTLAAYVVSQSFSVKVRKISDAGKIIGGIGEYGATNLSGLTFSVDREDDVAKEARAKAIAEARQNAEVLARELGVTLVRIIGYSEGGYGGGPIYYEKAMLSGTSRVADVAPEIPAGETKITSNVSVTYEVR